GIAFQIVDDILDVIGDGARLGKRAGTDLREGNVTLVAIHALNNGGAIDHEDLARIMRSRHKADGEVDRALRMIRDAGAVEKARADARHFGALAKESVVPLPDSEAKASLLRLVDYVLARDA
ncbi:MAG: polyprenyl synthetase family protein, partial [Methanobacteriota archaeon]